MTAHSLFDMHDPSALVVSHNRGVGHDVRLGILVNNTKAALPGERSREPWEKPRSADLEIQKWRARQEQMLAHLKALKAANQKLETRNREVEHQLIHLTNQLQDNQPHEAIHFPGSHPSNEQDTGRTLPTAATGTTKEKRRPAPDADLLTRLDEIMEKNLEEADFNVHKMCRMMHLSHMQFIRKIKQLTGKKPIDLLKSFRLKKAKELLLQSNLTVAQIAYKVGYDMPNSFSRAFRKEFGISPTEYTGG